MANIREEKIKIYNAKTYPPPYDEEVILLTGKDNFYKGYREFTDFEGHHYKKSHSETEIFEEITEWMRIIGPYNNKLS